MTKSDANPSNFTLTELLVVIAIVAVLIALLLPVISGMSENGKTAKCAGNFKQISVALNQAMAENELKVPFSIASPAISYSGRWEFWYATVAPYFPNP